MLAALAILAALIWQGCQKGTL